MIGAQNNAYMFSFILFSFAGDGYIPNLAYRCMTDGLAENGRVHGEKARLTDIRETDCSFTDHLFDSFSLELSLVNVVKSFLDAEDRLLL